MPLRFSSARSSGAALALLGALGATTHAAVPPRGARAGGAGHGGAEALADGLWQRTLPNGLLVVVREDHAVPAVAVTAVVGAGSVDETDGTAGSSHFLEHVLFNGTTTRTQEQLYRDTDALGLYNNAFTREEYTAFQFLGPAEHLDAMMDLQADMLFRSTLPPEKVEKERGIILEEIAKDQSAGADPARAAFDERILELRPATGTPQTVESLAREALVRYWQERYVPENVVLLVNGDVTAPRAFEAAQRHYRTDSRAAGQRRVRRERLPMAFRDSAADPVSLELAPPLGAHAWLVFPMPAPTEADFVAALVVERSLGARLRADLGDEAEAWLDVSARTPVLVLHAWGEAGSAAALRTRLATWADALPDRLSREDIERAARALGADEVLQAEQPHYYAFYRAALLAARATRSLVGLLRLPESVPPRAVTDLVQSMVSGKRLAVVGSASVPADPPAAAVSAEAAGAPARGPSLAPGGASGGDGRLQRSVLPGGLTLVTEEAPGTGVVGVVALLRKEPSERASCLPGGAEIVHRTFLDGTRLRTAAELEQDLADMGAQLKVVDDPSLPYDDYLLSPEFGYIRLKAPASEANGVLRLLGEMLTSPRLDASSVTKARAGALEAVRKGSGAGERARRVFDANVLGAAAWPARGSASGLDAVTPERIDEFARRYLSPGNLIVSIVSPLAHEDVRRGVVAELRAFGRGSPAPSGPVDRCPATPDVAPPAAAQSWVLAGEPLAASPAEVPALRAANAYLSERVAQSVREEEGLAYSVGTEVLARPSSGWFRVSFGTRPQNVDRAVSAARDVVVRELAQGFDAAAFRAAVQGAIGRQLMRRLPSDGRAFQAALAELRGEPLGAPAEALRDLARVTPEEALATARAHVHPEQWKVVVAP